MLRPNLCPKRSALIGRIKPGERSAQRMPSLRREPDRIESPSCHQDLLKEVKHRVEFGVATFSAWEKAKVSIRDWLK